MAKKTTVGIFLAAAAVLSTNAIIPEKSIAHDNCGGLKEWTSDQKADEDGSLIKQLKKQERKQKKLIFVYQLVKEKIAGKIIYN